MFRTLSECRWRFSQQWLTEYCDEAIEHFGDAVGRPSQAVVKSPRHTTAKEGRPTSRLRHSANVFQKFLKIVVEDQLRPAFLVLSRQFNGFKCHSQN